jgi:hypothetical protein
LHSEGLYDTCASAVLMTVIRSKMGALCITHGANVWFKNLKGSGHLEVGGLGGSVILKWICKKLFCGCGMRVTFGSKMGQRAK